jgi:hypothetical protein
VSANPPAITDATWTGSKEQRLETDDKSREEQQIQTGDIYVTLVEVARETRARADQKDSTPAESMPVVGSRVDAALELMRGNPQEWHRKRLFGNRIAWAIRTVRAALKERRKRNDTR